MNLFSKYIWVVIPIAVFAFYWQGLTMFFVADDWYFLQGVNVLKNTYSTGDSINHFRPIPLFIMSLWANSQSPAWIPHLINLIFHSINGVLVYLLILKYVKDRHIALLGGLIWVICPVMAEITYWNSAIFTHMCVMWTLLMLLSVRRTLLSLIFFTCALLSHEQAFILGVLMPFAIPAGKWWKSKGMYFWYITAVVFGIRHAIIGGIGIYGVDTLYRILNPMNWFNTIGYFLKCLV